MVQTLCRICWFMILTYSCCNSFALLRLSQMFLNTLVWNSNDVARICFFFFASGNFWKNEEDGRNFYQNLRGLGSSLGKLKGRYFKQILGAFFDKFFWRRRGIFDNFDKKSRCQIVNCSHYFSKKIKFSIIRKIFIPFLKKGDSCSPCPPHYWGRSGNLK